MPGKHSPQINSIGDVMKNKGFKEGKQ